MLKTVQINFIKIDVHFNYMQSYNNLTIRDFLNKCQYF